MRSGGTVLKARSGTCSGLPLAHCPGWGGVWVPRYFAGGQETWWSRWTSRLGGFALSRPGSGVCLPRLARFPTEAQGCCDLSGPWQGLTDGRRVGTKTLGPLVHLGTSVQLGFDLNWGRGGVCGKKTRYFCTLLLHLQGLMLFWTGWVVRRGPFASAVPSLRY